MFCHTHCQALSKEAKYNLNEEGYFYYCWLYQYERCCWLEKKGDFPTHECSDVVNKSLLLQDTSAVHGVNF